MAEWRTRGGISPRVLNVGTRWKYVLSFKPKLLYSMQWSSQYSPNRRLDVVAERYFLPLSGIKAGLSSLRSFYSTCFTDEENYI
jgi:hypothetical protein